MHHTGSVCTRIKAVDNFRSVCNRSDDECHSSELNASVNDAMLTKPTNPVIV